MNHRIILILLSCLFVGVRANAHELEDGFVERAIEVVVRDQTLQVNYFVGLNETTMNELLKQWNSNDLEASLDPDITAQFESELLQHLQSKLEFKIDGVRVELDTTRIEQCPKHHFDFVAKLKYELPADQTVELSLSDRDIDHWNSAARYSLKGVGSTIVSRTNVAPIIIRAKRIEFIGLNDEARFANSKITATVTTPPSSSELQSSKK